MSQAQRPKEPTEGREVMHLGELMILSSLWMLFGFMLWYYLAFLHGIPVRMALDGLLGLVLDEQFYNVIANPDRAYLFQVQTRIPFTFPDGSTEPLGFIVNPLVYGYGLPLLFGLVMGTSQRLARKLLVLLSGYLVISLVQLWGSFWESLKTLVFGFGGEARVAVLDTGIPENLIALCYQLGVLIFPALAPVVVWLLGNWREVEAYTRSWQPRR
jgi:hypothetical protein